jgi:hypothetical protein
MFSNMFFFFIRVLAMLQQFPALLQPPRSDHARVCQQCQHNSLNEDHHGSNNEEEPNCEMNSRRSFRLKQNSHPIVNAFIVEEDSDAIPKDPGSSSGDAAKALINKLITVAMRRIAAAEQTK